MIRVQTRESPTYTSTREDYVLTDAQGSTYAIVKDTGTVLGIMGFDPWGLRRTATNWTPLANPLTFDASGVTRHGYTGHEQVDEAGLIHMNGRAGISRGTAARRRAPAQGCAGGTAEQGQRSRIYDPKLMRFVQADPIIQSPFDSQSYNRYTYVFNNPLAHTDPTGYWGKEEQGYLRAAVAIVITIYTGGTAAGASWGAFSGASLTTGQAFAVTVIGGAAAGAVQTGTLKGAATGAISGAMFFGIGNYFDTAGWAHLGKDTANALSGTGHAAKTLAHGVAGGITAELGGGNFGNGFISAGVTQAFAPGIDHIDGGNAGFSVLRTVSAAAVGGTASALSGGKFANGAVTAAFARAFNDESMKEFARQASALKDQFKFMGEAKSLALDDWNTLFPMYPAFDDNDLLIAHADFELDFNDALTIDLAAIMEPATQVVIGAYMDRALVVGARGASALGSALSIGGTSGRALSLIGHAATINRFQSLADVKTLQELAGTLRRDAELSMKWNRYVEGSGDE